jgi:glucosamine--fructose-6-phosphate aminotransferase (isomerizing)
MCGIFGLVAKSSKEISPETLQKSLNRLFTLSESRGKEAAGIAFRSGASILVHKEPRPASAMIRRPEYQKVLSQALAGWFGPKASSVAFLGHSRLVTNGFQGMANNNQPVIVDALVGVHNGIVCNDAAIWKKYPELKKTADVDTEALMALLRHQINKHQNVARGLQDTFAEIIGAASIAVFPADSEDLLLATNNGSLYFAWDRLNRFFVFSSELYILTQFIESSGLAPKNEWTTQHLAPQTAVVLNLSSLERNLVRLAEAGSTGATPVQRLPRSLELVDSSQSYVEARRRMKRCSKCILPETMPFIEFDGAGVCNYCRSHKPSVLAGEDALMALANKYRRTDGRPDCILAFSGGRDSSYGLHYMKTVLKLNPVAYTYDWGMVTDLARRNISRMCGKLGVEHILVSADIKQKRKNIRKNVMAWCKKPDLGTVPLFMAGDKAYFTHANELSKQMNAELMVFCANSFERTNFKLGFCGVREKNLASSESIRISKIPLVNKLKLLTYYGWRFLMNPAFINSSLLDSFRAYLSTYFTPHNYSFLFDYIPWDEALIDRTLKEHYDWEVASDTDNTWRIGDGTAAFYNHIYYTVAGFSEIDTFRSNQIREGIVSREAALKMSEIENRPRYESMLEYARLVGFDLDDALNAIDDMPKLYMRPELFAPQLLTYDSQPHSSL